jgi:hypothetical protein
LNHDGVFGGADEGLDVQQLLDFPKENFDLPAALVERSYRVGRPPNLIRNKFNHLLVLGIPNRHSA